MQHSPSRADELPASCDTVVEGEEEKNSSFTVEELAATCDIVIEGDEGKCP